MHTQIKIVQSERLEFFEMVTIRSQSISNRPTAILKLNNHLPWTSTQTTIVRSSTAKNFESLDPQNHYTIRPTIATTPNRKIS